MLANCVVERASGFSFTASPCSSQPSAYAELPFLAPPAVPTRDSLE
jgi:hypothetical protein